MSLCFGFFLWLPAVNILPPFQVSNVWTEAFRVPTLAFHSVGTVVVRVMYYW